MFDYILTGPISGVSAGQYITGLMNELMVVANQSHWLPPALQDAHGHPFQFDMNLTSAVFAAAVTIYYWWQNVKGIEESSDKALRVMQITTIMVVVLFIWGGYSLMVRGVHMPPLPSSSTLKFSDDALGFLKAHEPGPGFGNVRHPHGLWALHPGHERRGEPGPGQPRDRASQAQKPQARRHRYRNLQPHLHGRRNPAGVDADTGMARARRSTRTT